MVFFDGLRDLVSSVYNAASSAVSKVGNVFGTLGETAKNWSEGFYSAPGGYKFCGAGNRLDNEYVNQHLPNANESDRACFAHDKDYELFKKQKDKGAISDNELRNLVRESDNRLISNLQKSKNRDFGSYLSEWGIGLKKFGEDLGLIRADKFVT